MQSDFCLAHGCGTVPLRAWFVWFHAVPNDYIMAKGTRRTG